MSAHSYHIPVNKIVSQTRKTEPVTTIVSTSPPDVAAKTINPLPTTTIAHLENIFEAVKKQPVAHPSKLQRIEQTFDIWI
ncbi:2760_t:CDS:2, partial [Acaulospora colombiana]